MQRGVVAAAIHPDDLDAGALGSTVIDQLHLGSQLPSSLSLTALPQITRHVSTLLQGQHAASGWRRTSARSSGERPDTVSLS